MPEGLEAEIWRRALEVLVDATITRVEIDDRVADRALPTVLPGNVIRRVNRLGKVVTIETAAPGVTEGPTVGLHFGMTGRIEVNGAAAIDRLEYASGRDLDDWDRLRLWVDGHEPPVPPAIRFNDPRRLGRISLDPDLSHLGVDLFAIDRATLRAAIGRRRTAIKSVLLDQSAVAGLGNLCVDEVLWWAGVAPNRPADDLTDDEIGALTTAIRRRMPIMQRRGGSTTGALSPAVRTAVGHCPRDGAPLERATIGGRTAVWCAEHQR